MQILDSESIDQMFFTTSTFQLQSWAFSFRVGLNRFTDAKRILVLVLKAKTPMSHLTQKDEKKPHLCGRSLWWVCPPLIGRCLCRRPESGFTSRSFSSRLDPGPDLIQMSSGNGARLQTRYSASTRCGVLAFTVYWYFLFLGYWQANALTVLLKIWYFLLLIGIFWPGQADVFSIFLLDNQPIWHSLGFVAGTFGQNLM